MFATPYGLHAAGPIRKVSFLDADLYLLRNKSILNVVEW